MAQRQTKTTTGLALLTLHACASGAPRVVPPAVRGTCAKPRDVRIVSLCGAHSQHHHQRRWLSRVYASRRGLWLLQLQPHSTLSMNLFESARTTTLSCRTPALHLCDVDFLCVWFTNNCAKLDRTATTLKRYPTTCPLLLLLLFSVCFAPAQATVDASVGTTPAYSIDVARHLVPPSAAPAPAPAPDEVTASPSTASEEALRTFIAS